MNTIYRKVLFYICYLLSCLSPKFIYGFYNVDCSFLCFRNSKLFYILLFIVSRYFTLLSFYIGLCSEVWMLIYLQETHRGRSLIRHSGRKHTFHKWTVNFFPILAPMYSGTLEQLQWGWWMFQTGCHWTPAILKGHRVKKMKILHFGKGKVTLAWQSNQQIALCSYLSHEILKPFLEHFFMIFISLCSL